MTCWEAGRSASALQKQRRHRKNLSPRRCVVCRQVVDYGGSGGTNTVDFVTEEEAELHAQRRAVILIQHIRLHGVKYLLGCAPQRFGVSGSRPNFVFEPSGARLIDFFTHYLSSYFESGLVTTRLSSPEPAFSSTKSSFGITDKSRWS